MAGDVVDNYEYLMRNTVVILLIESSTTDFTYLLQSTAFGC